MEKVFEIREMGNLTPFRGQKACSKTDGSQPSLKAGGAYFQRASPRAAFLDQIGRTKGVVYSTEADAPSASGSIEPVHLRMYKRARWHSDEICAAQE